MYSLFVRVKKYKKCRTNVSFKNQFGETGMSIQLELKMRELIAVGASIAANCQPYQV